MFNVPGTQVCNPYIDVITCMVYGEFNLNSVVNLIMLEF